MKGIILSGLVLGCLISLACKAQSELQFVSAEEPLDDMNAMEQVGTLAIEALAESAKAEAYYRLAQSLDAERTVSRRVLLSRAADTGHQLAVESLIDLAKAGDAIAANELALILFRSAEDPLRSEPPEVLLKQAADAGLPAGQYNLGLLYLWRKSTADYPRMLALLESAAQSIPQAQSALGHVYFSGGLTGEPEYQRAVSYLEAASRAGMPQAQYTLAHCYETGKGTAPNPLLAIDLAYASAVGGYQPAYRLLVYLLDRYAAEDVAAGTVIRVLEFLAAEGDDFAMKELGMRYYHGTGIEQNDRLAFEWLNKAADQGSASALSMVGVLYEEGRHVERDPAQAFALYRRAAEQGDAYAQSNLGDAYARGVGVPVDYAQAAIHWRQAADQGDIDAKVDLANLLAQGLGVEPDPLAAIQLFEQAASQGDARALMGLAMIHLQGIGVPVDLDRSRDLLSRAAAAGIASAEATLIFMTVQSGEIDADTAIERLEQVAAEGNTDAQLTLAALYQMTGRQGPDGDYGLAVLREAARTDDSDAAYRVAIAYYRGIGVDCNPEEAFRRMQGCAEFGMAPCQTAVADFHLNGIVVERDPAAAFDHYLNAAEVGDGEAATMIGDFFQFGWLDQKDPGEAAKWYERAIEQGSTTALTKLAWLATIGSGVDQDLSRARRLCEQANQQGSRVADYCLGYLHENGLGHPEDPYAAADWYRKGVDKDSAAARWGLSQLILSDRIRRPEDEGIRLLKEAADRGHLDAMKDLAERLATGDGLPQDRERAYFWFEALRIEQDEQVSPQQHELAMELDHKKRIELESGSAEWVKEHSHKQMALCIGPPDPEDWLNENRQP